MEIKKIKSGTDWENQVGYSRVVRAGNHVFVSGTTSTGDKGTVVGKGDVYRQTKQAILNIEKALKKADATLEDVIRTRTFITTIDAWEEFARAHKEFFGNISPAATLVEVTRLIHPELLVEIEVDAFIKDD